MLKMSFLFSELLEDSMDCSHVWYKPVYELALPLMKHANQDSSHSLLWASDLKSSVVRAAIHIVFGSYSAETSTCSINGFVLCVLVTSLLR